MSDIQRGIVELLHDLDRRARPGREPKNRAISKFQTLTDTVQLSSDTITATVQTPPYQYSKQSYRSAVIADTPTAYWRLGENAPAVTANDEMNTYHGTAGAAVNFGATGPVVSESNNAARFNGTTTGVISVPHSTNLNASSSGAFSVEVWVNPTSSAASIREYVMKADAGTVSFWLLRQSATASFQFFPNNGTLQLAYSPASFPVNQWSHVVGVYTGSSARLYLNGALVASAACTSGTNSTGAVTIGGSSTIGQLFAGTIDEVAIYGSVALTSTRIKAHYDAMITPTATGTSLVVGAGQFR